MYRLTLLAVFLLPLFSSCMASADGSEIKSRVLGAKLRIVERACKANLAAYCQQHGGRIPKNLTFDVMQDSPQYDVKCTARCGQPAKK